MTPLGRSYFDQRGANMKLPRAVQGRAAVISVILWDALVMLIAGFG
jgi:hypothetical protein